MIKQSEILKNKSIQKYSLIAIILVLLVGVFYKKVYIPKTTYDYTLVKVGAIDVNVKGIGNVNAKDIYNITAQSGGKILHLYTDIGKWVKKGDLLIEIDGVDLPDQLEITKVTLQKANFEFTASQEELKNQQAQKVLIKKSFHRYQKLNKQGFAARAEYDKALADLKSIDAMISASKAQINIAKAQIEVAQKNIDAIQTKIDNLKIYSPINGYVISKNAQIGQAVLPTMAIFNIVDPKTLWVETKIDERISANVKVNQKATIMLSSQPNKIYKAVIKRILPKSDAITLEREVDVAFEHIPTPFYINEQAEVRIKVSHYDKVSKIPLTAVVQKEGKVGVWIAKDGHAHFQIIQKIAQNDSEMAVSNIDKKAKIIIPSKSKKPLSEGMKIHL